MKESDKKRSLLILGTTVVIVGGYFLFIPTQTQDYSKFNSVTKKTYIKQDENIKKAQMKKTQSKKSFRSVASRYDKIYIKPDARFIRPKRVNSSKVKRLVVDNFDIEKFSHGVALVENVHAIKKEDFHPGDFELIAEQSIFYIVKSEYPPVGALPVVAIKGSKSLNIMTGKLTIQFYNYEQGVREVIDKNLKLYEEYEHLDTLMVELSSYEQTIEFYKIFKESENVKDVNFEILSGLRVSK